MSDCFTGKRDELRLGHHSLFFFTAPSASLRPGGGGDAGTIYFHLHYSFGGKTGYVEKVGM
jgi:hypothetical protein